jgi:hypothetical protein
MTHAPNVNGILIDKATRFGERFGFPALVAVMLIAALIYGGYFVLRYEVFYTRGKVEAMSGQMDTMSMQHSTILSKQEAALEMQSKEVKIQCATCWNGAGNQAEIKRCGCNPDAL